MYFFPFSFFQLGGFDVSAAFCKPDFPELFLEVFPSVRIEVSGFEGLDDGAAGFGGMGAVAEFALSHEIFDVLEGTSGFSLSAPDLEFAHTWRVDNGCAIGDIKEFTVCSCVTAPAVDFTDFAGFQAFVTQEPVDDRGFTHAGGSDEDHGLSGLQVRMKDFEAGVFQGAEGKHGYTEGDGLDLLEILFGAGAEVGFIEQDDGIGAAVPDLCEVPLDAAGIEVAVQAGDQEHGVDIGCDDLLLCAAAGFFPAELTFPRQQLVDQSVFAAVQQHNSGPVTHCGQICCGFCHKAQFAGKFAVHFAVFMDQCVNFPA